MIRQLLSEILKLRGYEVRTAQDGLEGVEKFREQSCDLILLDIAMPRMDGMEALRHFRALDAHVGIVLITGHGGDQERIAGENLGAVFTHKPFTLSAMQALLSTLETERSRWREENPAGGPVSERPITASAADRRSYVRANVNLQASVSSADSPEAEPLECRVVDISLGGGGMQFHIDHPFTVGSEVGIIIHRGGSDDPLDLLGAVVWADHESGSCGVHFHDLTEDQTQSIEDLVVAVLETEGPKA